MKIHEYQAKAILKNFGVAVPRGDVAYTPAEARAIAQKLGGRVVIKAQIHAGGRGKGGGIKLADGPDAAETTARAMLGMRLVTPQTGPEGKVVQRVLVEEALDRDRELYLGLVVDRSSGLPVMMASSAGGMDIEEVAAKTPELILKESIDPVAGFAPFQARKLAYGLGLDAARAGKAAKIMAGLHAAFTACDASLAEINPMITTKSGDVLALDAKINLDDNALYRHHDLRELRDIAEEEPLEVEASKYSLNYIKLNGSVGCMVNGAGLAMATMDIIKLAGGEPANFLDVGGGATTEQVTNAFRIILSDPHVKAVLINIFGGIMRCDIVAQGVVEASRQVGVKVPVVVRLEGTNKDEGATILRNSGLNFTVAEGMRDAADKVVAQASGKGGRLMAVLVNEKSRIVVQGLTGKEGTFHARACKAYHNTQIVAGVTPGKGGQHVDDIPVYDTVAEAVRRQKVDVSLIFVPPAFAADAVMEAADAGVALAICISEGIPALDMVRVKKYLAGGGTRLVGPNCPGVISPERAKVGIMPGRIHKKGSVGVVSRSGTLTYEGVDQLTRLGIGQSTCIGIGGDPIIGTTFIDALALFAADPDTKAILMIGEIGGTAEEEAAAFIKKEVKKPVAAFIAGRTAPPGKRMGHAGAIISGGHGTAAEKVEALRAAGITVADSPATLGETIARVLKGSH